MYIKADATSITVQLYLRHKFFNIIFKIKLELYTASGSAFSPPLTPPRNIVGARLLGRG